MKETDIYDAISGIDEKYCTDSEDFEDIAIEFRRKKILTAGKIVSFAACLAAAVIVSLNIFDKNIITDRSSLIKPSYPPENHHVTSSAQTVTESVSRNEASESKVSTASDVKKTETSVSHTKTSAAAQTSADVTKNDKNNGGTVSVITDTDKKESSAEKTTVHSRKPDNNSSKPAVTNPVTRPAVTTEYTTVITDSAAEKTTAPESGVKPPGNNNNGSMQDGNEMNNSLQYSACDFDGISYTTMNKTVDSVLIGKYLGDVYMYGFDSYNNTNCSCRAKAYEIKNVPKTDMIAVLFEDETDYFTYVNK